MTEIISEAAQERALVQRQIIHRLKRAHGQLGAVIKAVESDADCRAVITQLAAVSAAVDRAGFAIIASGLKHCLAGDGDDGDEAGDPHAELTVADFEKLFMMLA